MNTTINVHNIQDTIAAEVLRKLKEANPQLNPEEYKSLADVPGFKEIMDRPRYISFNEWMWLKLHPRNEQERLAWLKADGWHGKGIDIFLANSSKYCKKNLYISRIFPTFVMQSNDKGNEILRDSQKT